MTFLPRLLRHFRLAPCKGIRNSRAEQLLLQTRQESTNITIQAACLLERLPVVTPQDDAWETEYATWQASVINQYRKKFPKEFQQGETTAEDTGNQWQPESRITKADAANDQKSLQRKLDRRLFLVLKAKAEGRNGCWMLPSRPRKGQETTRETAERALSETTSGESKVFFLGHAPVAHWDTGTALTVIHKAQLIKGNVTLTPDTEFQDFAWLCREEILEELDDAVQKKILSQLLPKL